MLRRYFGCALLVVLGGCATAGGNPKDPLEGFNRAVFGFNDGLDRAIIKPVATGYKNVMPEFARTGVTNFFSNLGDLWIGINNVLQGKVREGASDFGRFAMNSTVGILGLIDVASNAGLDKHNEDFGQTLGRWGVGSGAYVVLPLLGPSTVRDGVSLLAVDWHGDPLWYVNDISTRNELIGARAVDTRARLLDTSSLLEEAALDHYAYVRDAYLQRRRNLIYDGEPPPQPDPDKDSNAGTRATTAFDSTELPQAVLVTVRGERVTSLVDGEMTPAKEFAVSDSAATPATARIRSILFTANGVAAEDRVLAEPSTLAPGAFARTSLQP